MKRQVLINALDKVSAGLAKTERIAGSTSFAFLGNRVCTFNDQISVSTTIPDLNITGSIESDKLYKILNKLSSEDIEIELKNDNEVVLTAGRSHCGFRLASEIKLPLDQIGKKGKYSTLPEDFLEALEFTMSTCARDMSRPVLTCINVASNGKIDSSDNYRVSRYITSKIPVKTFLLPASAAQTLVKYKVTKIAEGENWVHFATNDNTEFSCRTFEDTFPNVDKWFEVQGPELELPELIREVLDRAAIFCTQKEIEDQRVQITISHRRLKLRAEADNSWFEEELNMMYKGETISFVTNPHLLRTITKETRQCIIGERCLRFHTDKWEHVVALIVS